MTVDEIKRQLEKAMEQYTKAYDYEDGAKALSGAVEIILAGIKAGEHQCQT